MTELSQTELRQQIEIALAENCERTQKGLRDGSRDSFKITPHINFFEGTPEHPTRHITSGYGRLVNLGLISLANFIGCSTSITYNYYWCKSFGVGTDICPPGVPSIRLGTGTTATIHSTNALATAITTAPDTATGSTSNPSAGTYRVTLNATWNAGALGTPTITEAAFYAYTNSVLQAFGTDNIFTNTITLVDRVCSSNGDFSSFVVDSGEPLTAQYEIDLTYV